MSAWANRKAAVQAEADALAKAEQQAEIAEQHAALAELPEAERLATLDLPNPDDMQAGDDFTAFMKDTVPAALRNRALRSLWRSNPALANVDMLVDYGEDFTGKGDALGVIKTVYKVGKGMLADDEAPPEAPVMVPEPAEEPDADEVVTATEAPQPAVAFEAEDPAQVGPPMRRRMRFEFVAGDVPATREMETL